MQIGKAIPHSIEIHPTDNFGFLVICGCARFTFKIGDEVVEALREYLDNPQGFESEYRRTKITPGLPTAQPEGNTGTDMR